MRHLLLCGAALALAACASDPTLTSTDAGTDAGSGGTTDAGTGGAADAAAPKSELLAVIDLPRVPETRGLSGTWYDASTRTLLAIQDLAARLVPLQLAADLRSITVGAPLELTDRPGSAWDGEALVRKGDQILAVTVETEPLIERFDVSGAYLGKIDVPAVYAAQASNNKGLESLALSPSGGKLFTINESALTVDGQPATKAKGTLVRLLRRDLATGDDEARAYRTEPLGAGTGGDMGVSDLLALSDAELLVLERGFQADYGNTVRIFRVDLASSGADVLGEAALGDATPVLQKTLVLDLGTLPAEGVTHPGVEPNPILDNYEALALGPVLDDGRRVVFVTSDDNASATQVARVLVLAVAGL